MSYLGTRLDVLGLLLVLAVTLLARLIPALMLGAEVSDLSLYRRMAVVVIREEDIYEARNLFPYTPLSLFVAPFALHLATVFEQPFHLVMKWYAMVGDLGTATLIVLLAKRRWGALKATLAGLVFAFNPVSILITGLHGNIMPLSVFFAFWAYYLLETGSRREHWVLSALALGIGIGLRGWPILLLPFLVRPGVAEGWFAGWRPRLLYVVIAAVPSALTLAPYLLVNWEGVNREFFGYTSVTDFGWMSVWRNIWFLETGNTFLPGTSSEDWVARSRTWFMAGYALIVAAAFLRPRLLDTTAWIATALLLFYSVFGGVAAQYYVWILPFIAFRWYGILFSIVAAGAIMAFYLTYHPGILLGPYPSPVEYTRHEIVRLYTGFLIALWAVGASWLVWAALRGVADGVQSVVTWRSRELAG